MIEVKNIYYSYTKNDKYAVNDVSFTIAKGEIFGFLGSNGCGKTTTMLDCCRHSRARSS